MNLKYLLCIFNDLVWLNFVSLCCCKHNLFESKENVVLQKTEFLCMNIVCYFSYSLQVGCGMYKYCITSDTDLHLGKADISKG